ncbi:DNA-binding response regulator [Tenacibaculum todarodis]|uniref:DNA-binding response regulator n=1 Tax=Tenacibaculum todarodis TaxID=1850252 RepID=A0A1L3JG97_9FLAO|nr:LytTR family DNA-binding domain-containing protein [Tenacibaculum todarodis]APG64144.1 DNA-binding response regulator [Tenacibaculum todarodis]
MKVLIIEDELPSARRLERMLANFNVEVLATTVSIKESVTWLQTNTHPAIIFLDVHLSDGLSFEIFNQVKTAAKIIFTTAYSDYSIRAFDYDSISYLLKPIKLAELEKAIVKGKEKINNKNDFENLKELFANYKTKNYKDSFTVKNGSKIKIIKAEKVCCFYSYDNATFIKTNDFKGIINYSLSSLENELNPDQFFRVNRTFIVHINAIKDIVSYTNSRLQIKLNSYNESEIIVSRERVKDFKNWID